MDQLQYINLDFNRGVSSVVKHRFSYRSVFLSCGMELFYGSHSQLNIFLTFVPALDRFPRKFLMKSSQQGSFIP